MVLPLLLSYSSFSPTFALVLQLKFILREMLGKIYLVPPEQSFHIKEEILKILKYCHLIEDEY